MKKLTYILVLSLVISSFFIGCDKTETPTPIQSENNDDNTNDDDNSPSGSTDRPDSLPSIVVNPTDVADGPHYILGFYEITQLEARTDDDLTVALIVARADNKISYFDNVDDPERAAQFAAYKTLCELYGDTSYDKIREFYVAYTDGYNYLRYNPTAIDIVSATNYDDAHPAGTSLRDLCELITWTPRDYIASGYADTYDWSVRPDFLPEAYYNEYLDCGQLPFRVRLDQCTPEDLVLIGDGNPFSEGTLLLLRFDKAPDAGNALQKFTITLTDERGQTYTATSDVAEWQ